MADEFMLTSRPIRVTGPAAQQLSDALDVSDYDLLDAVCTIDGIEAGGAVTGLAVRLISGMQKETSTGWVEVAAFTPGGLNTVGKADAVHVSEKLLKYLRWEVTGLGGATAVVFDIAGMLRRRGA
jgi:hypothetical protein